MDTQVDLKMLDTGRTVYVRPVAVDELPEDVREQARAGSPAMPHLQGFAAATSRKRQG